MTGAIDATALDWLVGLLTDTAEAEILPRFRSLSAAAVRQKTSAADLVTDADIAAEKRITEALAARYPHALIVGEEAVSADRSRLDGLADADLAFTIDPVDGTFNFASGVPLFGVMLAAVERGETVAGVILDPICGDAIVAMRGGGAFVRRPGAVDRRLRVAGPVAVSQMTGAVSWQGLAEPLRSRIAVNQTRCLAPVGYRCAAHEYRLMATGHAHFALFAKLMPWDHLPGALIHAEAGGYRARFDGSPYRPGDSEGGLLAAPDRDSWEALRSAFFER